MKVSEQLSANHRKVLGDMDQIRRSWFSHWREISDFFLPRRYPWLLTQKEVNTPERRNKKLLCSTSTIAVRTLASGLMNGITSPARPWFRLRIAGFTDASMSHNSKLYIEECTRRLLQLMAESNFYNALAVHYLDWCTFGTASMGIYEDFDDVFRCYNYPLGEFYISHDSSLRVNRHARRFAMTLEQIVEKFGEENLSEQLRTAYRSAGANLLTPYEIGHIIEQNADDGLLRGPARWREVYWELSSPQGEVLSVAPFYEWPTVTTRWEMLGNDPYGTSPAMDALADVIELQAIRLRRAIGLDKQVSPPLIVDQQLRNRPKALGAGGITYAATSGQNFGAKEAYRTQLPYAELSQDIVELVTRIRETCHNNLFNMISQLDTVRSATEIDARREEKLIHLGPVLERFYNEGLDPALRRIFGIAQRAGLLPEPPEELADQDVEISYVSVLFDAQRASATAAIERFFAFTGQLTGVYPEAREIPNVEELLREYAESIGIKPKGMRSAEEVSERTNAAQQQESLAQTAEIGNNLASGAKVLSETDMGGGMSALQSMM